MSIVIPRSVWKPRYANGFAVIGIDEWLSAEKELWLHHSVTNPFGPDATLEQDCQHMRDFEQIGQNRFGGGISYTWGTMPSGRVFEGHSIDRQGSHTYQRNNRSRAICLAGNYDVNPLPDRMVRSVAALLQEVGATIDGPHSAVYPTACPGKYAAPRIPTINQLALGAPIGDEEDVELDDSVKTPDGRWVYVRDAIGSAPYASLLLERLKPTVDKLSADVAELKASGVPVELKLSDADKDDIATRIAANLAKRLEA